MSDTSFMHDGGESYSGVVPTRQPNESGRPPEEAAEGRPQTKENTLQSNPCRTQSRESGPNGLERVREAAKKDGKMQFTALLHHVTVDVLRDSYDTGFQFGSTGTLRFFVARTPKEPLSLFRTR